MKKIKAKVSFRACRGCVIRLSGQLLKLLNYPTNVRILLNKEKLEIGFQPSNYTDFNSFALLYSDNKPEVNICTKLMVDDIYMMCGWDLSLPYSVDDYAVTSDNIVIFNLKAAKIVKRNR